MLNYPTIDPVAISLGPLQVHWYGLTYLAGLAFAWWLAIKRSQELHAPIAREQVDDLIFYAAVGIDCNRALSGKPLLPSGGEQHD